MYFTTAARSFKRNIFRFPALAWILLLLAGSLGPPRPSGPPFAVLNCPQPFYPDEPALITALFSSDYRCTEDVARILRPRANSATLTALLALAHSDEHGLARRNALRLIGRFAEAEPGEPVGELVLHSRAGEVHTLLLELLADQRESDLLHDTIWLLDSFFYPSYMALPHLEALSLEPAHTPGLRERAAAAAARLLYARGDAVAGLAYALPALQSDLPGVRLHAALICARFGDEQLTGDLRNRVIGALEAAWAGPDPVAPALPTLPGSGTVESPASPFAARAALAAALDRYDGGTRLDELRRAFEQAQLGAPLTAEGIVVRSRSREQAQAALLVAHRLTEAFFTLLGDEFRAPLPDDSSLLVTILLFPDRAAYRDYMRAFLGFGADDDGIYVEARATLYTYVRTPGDSTNTLEETLRHELAHYLSGRHLFPGGWRTPGYHNEPKGWADEGLAEYLAGMGSSGANRRLAEVCERPGLPPLAALLAERAGYDQYGRFPYAEARLFVAFLAEQRPIALRAIMRAYRAGSYRVAALPALAGTTALAELEQEWHADVVRRCNGQR